MNFFKKLLRRIKFGTKTEPAPAAKKTVQVIRLPKGYLTEKDAAAYCDMSVDDFREATKAVRLINKYVLDDALTIYKKTELDWWKVPLC